MLFRSNYLYLTFSRIDRLWVLQFAMFFLLLDSFHQQIRETDSTHSRHALVVGICLLNFIFFPDISLDNMFKFQVKLRQPIDEHEADDDEFENIGLGLQ